MEFPKVKEIYERKCCKGWRNVFLIIGCIILGLLIGAISTFFHFHFQNKRLRQENNDLMSLQSDLDYCNIEHGNLKSKLKTVKDVADECKNKHKELNEEHWSLKSNYQTCGHKLVNAQNQLIGCQRNCKSRVQSSSNLFRQNNNIANANRKQRNAGQTVQSFVAKYPLLIIGLSAALLRLIY